jgi:hypothetical protein
VSPVTEWLYNGSDVKGRPADPGYYVGFKISEAYCTKSKDKKRAIRDILEGAELNPGLLAAEPRHAARLFHTLKFLAGNWPEISSDIPGFDQCSGC